MNHLTLITVWTVLLSFLVTSSAQAATYYFHTDHLGTPQVLTDQSQSVVWQGDYDPFGQATETVAVVEQNLRFPGQYFDRETGLHYNYFRTYDPQTGRYVESDPIGLSGGISTYGYAYQNPNIYTDPDGRFVWFGVPAVYWAAGAGSTYASIWWATNNPWVPDHSANTAQPWYQSKAKEDREQRPESCPSGTKPIDKDKRLDRDGIHRIKRGLRAGPTDWVGISPDGTIWTNEQGEAVDNGHYEDYLP